MTTIDPWQSGIGDICNVVDMDEIQSRFNIKMAPYFEKDMLIAIQAFSYEVEKDFRGGSFDVVYIDGSHKYKDVKRDIELYLPKVKKGGIIAGHDYRKKFPGVMKAVHETVGKPVRTFKDSSWIAFRK